MYANKASDVNFGVLLLVHFFTEDELTEEFVNVYGRSANGKNSAKMEPLDQEKINTIKRLYFKSVEVPPSQQQQHWQGVVNAMNKKMSEMRKYKK